MSRATAVVALILFLVALEPATALRAQQRTPTFSGKVTLLTLDVMALDRDGKPVAGLVAEDFEVKIDGRIQPVQAVAYLVAPRPSTSATNRPAAEPIAAEVSGRRTVANPVLPRESRVFVIFVDDLSFEAGAGKALLVSAEDFVSRVPVSDYVGYATSSGTRTVNPTRDRPAVLAALKSAVGQFANPTRLRSDPPMLGIGEALEIEGGNTGKLTEIMLRECFDPKTAATMTAQSIETLQRVSPCAAVVPFRASQIAREMKANRARQIQAIASTIESLGGVPGIKHLVLLSNGLAVVKEVEDLVPVARAAAVTGVEISSMVQEGDIDLSDLGSSVEPSGGAAARVNPGQAERRREDTQVLLGGAQMMTDMAGGQFYRVIGQPRRFFDRVEMSASAVYRLGIELPANLVPGRAISIAARVKREGVSALASRHAAAPTTKIGLSPDEQMKNAVARGDTLYGIPIELGAIVRRSTAPRQLELASTARVPGDVAGPLTAVLGLVDDKGALKSGKRTVPASTGGDYDLPFTFSVPPGHYILRLAIADAGGKVGSVAMPVKAALTPLGPLEASDVMTWGPDAKGRMQLMVLDDLPPGVGTLTAMLELYAPDPTPAGVAVRFAVLDAAARSVSEKQATITAGGGVLRADAPFDVSTLRPGQYGLVAAVSIGGQAAGTLTTTFRKK